MSARGQLRRPAGWLLTILAAVTGAAGLALLLISATQAQPLVADLSSHLIAISTGFTGTDVVLFGATDGPGEVAVVVSGPPTMVTVRRKDRLFGLWMNRASLVFGPVPAFYAVAVSRPLGALVKTSVLERHQIGLDRLRLEPTEPIDKAEADIFREALIRNKQHDGVYGTTPGQVTFLGERLFRTNLQFPANVRTGLYTVGVFLIRDGDVVSAQTTPLAVSKTGLSAEIFEFAQRRPFLYGLMAVAGAIMVGWLAGAMFRRG